MQGSAADAAGIRPGDFVLTLAGEPANLADYTIGAVDTRVACSLSTSASHTY